MYNMYFININSKIYIIVEFSYDKQDYFEK